MNDRLPWVDTTKCDIAGVCGECKASRLCVNGSFEVIADAGGCRIGIDYERCKRCGECVHACALGAVKMI